MAAFIDEKEVGMIEELTVDAEIVIEKDDERKDLKEKRGIRKQTLFAGSHKLKHVTPNVRGPNS
ncbi:MAG: hypothetical protein WCD00_02580 [Desulfuromonadaceae bacterium]